MIKEEVREVGQLIKISPLEAIVKIGTEILLLKGTGKVFKVVGKVGGKARAKLSPKFVGVKKNIIIVPSQVKGKTIKIEIGGTVKKLAEPLKKQVELAGKEVTAVSAQADKLINLIKKTKIVRKPIPGEKTLSKTTKKLLKKFDKGEISKRDLIKLDRRIRRETGRAGSLLERSFFADPRGRLRPSRLGITEKEASLSDILKGDVTFKTQKPQVLIFEKAIVEKFPKELKGIESKLKAGKPLTRAEANKFLQFQLKKSGKFKPVGAISKEPEITLAPGEIIKKGKTIAITIIQGKRVPIIRVEVVKATSLTKKLLIKAREGKITAKELKQLRVRLRKETGFKTSFSRGKIGKPRVRPPRPIPRRPPRRRAKPRRRPPRREPPRRRPPKRVVRKPVVRRPIKRPVRRPPTRPPRRPPKRPPKKPPRRPARRRRPRLPPIKPIPIKAPRTRAELLEIIQRRPQAYGVWARPLKTTKMARKPKLIKVSRVPLKKVRAEDMRNFLVDTSLARTASIRKIKGLVKKPKINVPKGYAKRTAKKFRTHRIVKGKRVPLPKGKVIEKRTRLLDTKQERSDITLRKRLGILRSPGNPHPKRNNPRRTNTNLNFFGNTQASFRSTPSRTRTRSRSTSSKNIKKPSSSKTKSIFWR